MKIWNFIKKYKKEIASQIIPIITFFIAISTWYSQQSIKEQYTRNANQIMINAADIEISNLDAMFDLVYHSDENLVQYNELLLSTDDMDENYKIISQLDVSSFNKKDTINYQIFRRNMRQSIKGIDTMLESINNDGKLIHSDKSSKSKNSMKLTKENKDNLLKAILLSRDESKRERAILKDEKTLYNHNLVDNDKRFESGYGSVLDKYRK